MRRTMTRAKIIVSSYYGTPNRGDQAIALALCQRLQAAGVGSCALLVFPNTSPTDLIEGTTPITSGVLRGFRKTCSAIHGASALIVGGGGLLQDSTSIGNVLFHASRICIATLTGTPTYLVGIGVGPLKAVVSRLVLRQVLRHVKVVVVRDTDSPLELERLGVERERIIVGADLAFLLDLPAETPNALPRELERSKQGDTRLLGISLRPVVGTWRARRSGLAGGRLVAQSFVRLLDRLNVEGIRGVFVSMNPEQDHPTGAGLRLRLRDPDGLIVLDKATGIGDIIGAMVHLDGMLSMRLHALVLAARMGVPIAAIAYDPKVRLLMRSLSQEGNVINLENVDDEQLYGLVMRLLEANCDGREALANAVDRQRQSAANAVRSVIDMMSEQERT